MKGLFLLGTAGLALHAAALVGSETSARVEVQSFGAEADDGKDDSAAVQAAIASLCPGQRLHFPKGVYQFEAPVWIENAREVHLSGDKGAVIVKKGGFQFVFAFRNSTSVVIEGLVFRGTTTDREEPAWGDDGVYFGSCRQTEVKRCRFFDFGDAAVRVTSSRIEGRADSEDAIIADCYFENVTQITTTQGMKGAFGGTNRVLIQNNTFENLKGSIKLAARAPTTGGRIVGNHVRSSRRDGIQVESVSDVLIEDNVLERITRAGVLLNINDHTPSSAAGFPWRNVVVRGNHFLYCASGVQVYLKPYPDGSEFDMEGMEVTENHFSRIGDNKDAVIWLANTTTRTYIDLLIRDNVFEHFSCSAEVRYPPDVKVMERSCR